MDAAVIIGGVESIVNLSAVEEVLPALSVAIIFIIWYPSVNVSADNVLLQVIAVAEDFAVAIAPVIIISPLFSDE